MPASIFYHGQSTLPDGRVLISGGTGGSNRNNVYIYTPSSNMWSEVASLPNSFQSHGQSILSDGRVLVSGGFGDNNRVDTTYLYNPNNNMWVSASPLPTSFNEHGQSTLNDGRVLVSGGNVLGIGAVNTAYIYTSTVTGTGFWNTVASLPISFRFNRQSTLLDGRVLVSPGLNSGGWGVYKDCYIYTPNAGNGTWSVIASIPVSFGMQGQSTLANGNVLISGGYYSAVSIYNTVYVYSVSNNKWDTVASLSVSSRGHGQSILADGRVLVSGGSTYNGSTIILDTAYIYTPAGWVAVGG